MKVVQIGSNKGNDDLSKYLKDKYKELDFGLFVEANPLHIGSLLNCYSLYENAIVENIAIKVSSYPDDNVKLYYHENDGPMYHVASLVKEHILVYYSPEGLRSFDIPCITIEQLFDKYEIETLDWLLLDIEGIDAEILLTTDWTKYGIKKIEYEKLHLGSHEKEIENLFKQLGYTQVESLDKKYDVAWKKL
jgi:FkbM family methyltransferase